MMTLLLLLLFVFGSVNSAWINVGSDLVGRVVHIESLRYRGYWLDSRSRPWLSMLHGIREDDIFTTERSKFKVIDCGIDEVCLEAVETNNRFLRAGYVLLNIQDPYIGFKSTTYPKSHGNLRWTIRCDNASLSNCRIDNKYYNSTLYSSAVYFPATGAYYGNPISHYRIIAPKPTDQYKTIFETENHSSVQQIKSIEMSEGIQHLTSVSIQVGLTNEIKEAFLAGTELSVNWSQTSRRTFESSTTLSYELTIPPKTKITLKQLIGSYGPFTVAAKKFQILSQKL